MVTCSFLSDICNLYDAGLKDRLIEKVEQILESNDAVEFYFTKLDPFELYCLFAVLEVKRLYKQKHIILTYVTKNFTEEKNDLTDTDPLPILIFDRVLLIPCEAKDKQDKKGSCKYNLSRAVIQNSDYVISREYPLLYKSSNQLFKYAQSREKVKIMDVCGESTYEYIHICLQELPEEERVLMEELEAGRTYKEIGEERSLTVSKVQTRCAAAEKNLRKKVFARYESLAPRERKPNLNCGILQIDNNHDPVLQTAILFEKIVNRLLRDFNTTDFLIEQSQCTSTFSVLLKFILKKLYLKGNQIHVVADSMDISQPDLDRLKQKCQPFYDGVIVPSSQAIDDIACREIIDRSDILICNLSTENAVTNMIREVSESKPILVIDLSKQASVIVDPDFLKRNRQ